MLKYIFAVIFHSLILCSSSALAANKVYVIPDGPVYGLGADAERCIVADTNEWECFTSNKYTINGRSKKAPITFMFNIYESKGAIQNFNDTIAMDCAKSYLYSRAKIKSSVFSSVHLKEIGKTYYIIEGEYFNNDSSGGFALYIHPIVSNMCYVMHVEIGDNFEVLDEYTKDNLYNEAFDLIMPLYSAS